MAHTKKYILEHYECDGQLSIDDLPFKDENVDNFVTNVDKNVDWEKICSVCILNSCEFCDEYFRYIEGEL